MDAQDRYPSPEEALDKEAEEALVQGCLRGKRDAQKAFYERFSKKMYAVCRGYASDTQEAKDLLQEGFIKVFKQLHRYRADGSLDGWVRRIFINCAIDHYRSNKKRKGYEFIENCFSEEMGKVDNEVLGELSRQEFLNMLRGLPEGYRLVLNLYFVESYTHKEIADTLDITVGTSKSQLAKAKSYLKENLLRFFDKETVESFVSM